MPLKNCRRWLEIGDAVPALVRQCTLSGLNGKRNEEDDRANVEKLLAIAGKFYLVAFVTESVLELGSIGYKYFPLFAFFNLHQPCSIYNRFQFCMTIFYLSNEK